MSLRRLASFTAFASAVALLAAAPASAPESPRKPAPAPAVAATPGPETDGVRFRAIGPATSGGRVAAVAGSDRDPMLYYVGGAGGGVFKSTDGGISFASVWNDASRFGAIGALAVAPSDASVVWAGTGESNPRNDVSYGDGMWRSTDAGKHWTHAGLDGTMSIARILVDPRDARHAIVAALGNPWADSAERGVYVTSDGGKTWAHTLYAGPASGAADLAWNPKTPNEVFASVWQFRRQPWIATSGGTADGLYRSHDFGRTWTKVTGHGFPGGLLGRIGVAVAPTDARRVYAVVQTSGGTIWRSDDGGTNWRMVSSDTRADQRPFYFSHLTVDPRNRDHVIAVSMYLTESKDGGRTWKHWVTNAHVDNHTIWWSADGRRVIEGNDGGVILSNDAGGSWAFLDRIPLAQIYHVGASNEKPYLICGGLQDNSSWCAPTTTRSAAGILNRDWFAIAGGDGIYAIPDPADPNLIWTNTQDGVLTIYDRNARHIVDVEPFPRDVFTSRSGLAESPYRFNWNAPLAFAPHDPKTVYFGGNVVFRTTDRGRHWQPISPDLTRNEKMHQQASGGPITLDVSGAEYYDTLLALAPSPKDANVIWAGADDGVVSRTADGGAHWSTVTPAGLPRYGRIATIEASPYDARTAFLVVDRHDLGDLRPYAFVTEDGGASWRSIAGGLPADAPLHVIRQDPKVPSLLYAGSENALWLSYDGGAHWERLRAGLPRVPVYDVQVQPLANDLLVATHGRGFFVLDDLAPLQSLAAARAAGAQLFPVRAATLWSSFPSVEVNDNNALTNDQYVGRNAPAGAVFTFYQRTPAKERPWFEIVDAGGRVVRTLRGPAPFDPADPPKDPKDRWQVPNDRGLNRLVWDGNETGPTRWNGTSYPNAGPTSGAEALPGTYTVRMHRDGVTMEQRFTLADDPQSPFGADDRATRHAYLTTLYGWIDGVDRALNTIDGRFKTARGPQRAALLGLRADLSSDARYDEDGITRPDRLRERIFGLIGVIGSSPQPPFEAHAAALDALRPDVAAAFARIRTTVQLDLTP